METKPYMNQTFPSREEIQQDVAEILLALANHARFAFLNPKRNSDALLWELLTARAGNRPGDLANPDSAPADLHIEWADVAETALGATMMQLYDYGVLALVDVSTEQLDSNENSAAWVCTLLHDLQRSVFLVEWDAATGGRTAPCVARCLFIAETANARVILEGGEEGFFPDTNPGLLTFRQLALLSGMTEASLRTIASRASGGLQTERRGNSTYIEVKHAKEWLTARKRYAPLRRMSSAGAPDLTKQRFANVFDFGSAVDDRLTYLGNELGHEVMVERLRGTPWTAPEKSPFGRHWLELTEQQMVDHSLMRRLGQALDLPERLFALRAAETVHCQALRRIELEIQEAKD